VPNDNLAELSAVELAALIRRGDMSPIEVTEAAIDRIERLNPHVAAVVAPLFERARERARMVHDEPFAGVPLVLKDAGQEIAGTPHWVGVAALRDSGHVSATTTPLAATFERLGFVIVGKSAVPQLAAGITTEPPGFAPTRNPWHLGRTAGGSSGGSAAAVAVGMVPIAHGSDGTGSLRFPASCCGLVTLKPSSGRIPARAPAGQPDPVRLWSEFVLTRRTSDLTALLPFLTGRPSQRPASGPLRVGLLRSDPILGAPLDPACAAAVEKTGGLLAELGHDVDDDWPEALKGVMGPIAGAIATAVDAGRAAQVRWVEQRLGRPALRGELDDQILDGAERGTGTDQAAVERAGLAISQAMAQVPTWWDRHDLLVTPTMRRPPWELGHATGPLDCGLFAAAFSFTGQPALAAPMSSDPSGVPIGVQLVARSGEDELLLGIGEALEEATGWHERTAPSDPFE
jgi:amidase